MTLQRLGDECKDRKAASLNQVGETPTGHLVLQTCRQPIDFSGDCGSFVVVVLNQTNPPELTCYTNESVCCFFISVNVFHS